MLDKSSADLLHVDMLGEEVSTSYNNSSILDCIATDRSIVFLLDSKQKQLETLLIYFTDVVKNTERLVAQLQKVSVDTSLKVEAQHHRYIRYFTKQLKLCLYFRHTVEVISLLTHLLNQLPEHCQLIEKLRQFKLKNDPHKVCFNN